jgi:hypothetical protein
MQKHRPPFSYTQRRTIIAPQVADRLTDERGPIACTRLPWADGQMICGETLKVSARVLPGCPRAIVNAIVAELPVDAPVVVGRDLLETTVAEIDTSTSPATITCRVR